jgi:RNA polymerase primary sigma factor
MTTHMENNHNDNQTKSTSALNQEEIQMYLKDIRKIKVMTPDRERELSDMMCSGKCTDAEKHAIYQELLEGNLRFVITVAKQYQNQGMELGDLIAEGNLGLMKAIKNFDWTKKLRFISYAVWWIKQSIIQSLNENSRMIRLPVNVVQDLQKAKKESQKNNTELDSRFTSLPKVIDLDMNINEEGDTLVDLIENTNAVQPDEGFNTAEMLKEKLRDIMKILDERERLIVEDYFGLSGTPRTLEDIGQDFNLTKERVRQIKEKALRKLRNESSVLFDYL